MDHLPLLGWMGKGLGWATGEVFRGKRVVCLREKDEGMDVAGCGIGRLRWAGWWGQTFFKVPLRSRCAKSQQAEPGGERKAGDVPP